MSTTFQLTTSDGLHLSGISYTPPGEIKAVVVLLHGMGEHFGRYKHVADFFSTIKYATLGWIIGVMGTLVARKAIHLRTINS